MMLKFHLVYLCAYFTETVSIQSEEAGMPGRETPFEAARLTALLISF